MSKNIKACLSHNTDNWRTPSFIYNHFINKGYRDLFEYESSYNQYNHTYDNDKLFINPPYSDMDNVINYVIDLFNKNNDIWLLIPVRSDTNYFYKLYKNCFIKIYFIKGRLKFNDGIRVAPFPSMLLHISPKIFLDSNMFEVITPMEILKL